MSEPAWLSRRTVEAIHERQLARHGGASGLRDPGLLESALMRALNAWSYGEADLHALASFYAEGIVKNHPFADGNKRTAFVAAALFLRINGSACGPRTAKRSRRCSASPRASCRASASPPGCANGPSLADRASRRA